MRFKIIYLWFSLPVLLAATWFFAFYSPVSSFIEKQRAELSAAKRTGEMMGKALRDVLETRKKDATARLSLDGISKNVPAYQQFPTLIRAITESGKKEGVVFDLLNSNALPYDSGQASPLMKPALGVGFKGKFLDIGKFLEAVEKQKGFKRIVEGRLSYADKDYPILTGNFLIEFVVWKGD